MVDFRFYAPTEVVFGKESEEHLVEMVRKCQRKYSQRCKGSSPWYYYQH